MSAIQVGNAPCSWGSLEFDGLVGEPIGYSQMLDELVETGYTGTELGDWGFMPTDPEVLRSELEARHVVLLGAFVPVALKTPESHEAGEAACLKVARLLEAASAKGDMASRPLIVLADENGVDPIRTKYAGRTRPEQGLSSEQWGTFAHGAERMAHAVREETGLRMVFHHHCAGYVETPAEIARLMDLTDPELLGLVFDTGHFGFGSGDPSGDAVLAGLHRFADRIAYMHYKDCAPAVLDRAVREGSDYFQAVADGVFCELGQGCVDFAAVTEWLRERGYHGWVVVEQDVLPGMGTPKESAARNREFLQGIGL
jgi:inosose dehydratase